MIELRTVFYWQGLSKVGKKLHGMEVCDHIDVARSLLKSRAIVVMQLTRGKRLVLSDRVPSTQDIVSFSQQLGYLLEADISLLNALDVLSEQYPARHSMRNTLLGLKAFVEDGRPLSEALKHYPGYFDTFYIQLVRVGETCGRLAEQLLQLGSYYEQWMLLKKNICKALYYPLGLLLFASAVLMAFMMGVIPRFEALFTSAGVQLPRLTQLLIDLSCLIRTYGLMALSGIGCLASGYGVLFRGRKGFTFKNKILLVPWVGNIIQTAWLARFSRTLSALLKNDVNLLEALTYTQNVSEYTAYKDVTRRVQLDLADGVEFAEALKRTRQFPVFFLQIIRTGQMTGQLSRNLEQLSMLLEKNVREATEMMTRLLEPVTLIVVGGIIGFFMLALYWPIFELGQAISFAA